VLIACSGLYLRALADGETELGTGIVDLAECVEQQVLYFSGLFNFIF